MDVTHDKTLSLENGNMSECSGLTPEHPALLSHDINASRCLDAHHDEPGTDPIMASSKSVSAITSAPSEIILENSAISPVDHMPIETPSNLVSTHSNIPTTTPPSPPTLTPPTSTISTTTPPSPSSSLGISDEVSNGAAVLDSQEKEASSPKIEIVSKEEKDDSKTDEEPNSSLPPVTSEETHSNKEDETLAETTSDRDTSQEEIDKKEEEEEAKSLEKTKSKETSPSKSPVKSDETSSTIEVKDFDSSPAKSSSDKENKCPTVRIEVVDAKNENDPTSVDNKKIEEKYSSKKELEPLETKESPKLSPEGLGDEKKDEDSKEEKENSVTCEEIEKTNEEIEKPEGESIIEETQSSKEESVICPEKEEKQESIELKENKINQENDMHSNPTSLVTSSEFSSPPHKPSTISTISGILDEKDKNEKEKDNEDAESEVEKVEEKHAEEEEENDMSNNLPDKPVAVPTLSAIIDGQTINAEEEQLSQKEPKEECLNMIPSISASLEDANLNMSKDFEDSQTKKTQLENEAQTTEEFTTILNSSKSSSTCATQSQPSDDASHKPCDIVQNPLETASEANSVDATNLVGNELTQHETTTFETDVVDIHEEENTLPCSTDAKDSETIEVLLPDKDEVEEPIQDDKMSADCEDTTIASDSINAVSITEDHMDSEPRRPGVPLGRPRSAETERDKHSKFAFCFNNNVS